MNRCRIWILSPIEPTATGRNRPRVRERSSTPDTAGQNDASIGRPPAVVPGGDGREFATDVALTAVR
ncbi:hypothetical protein EA473_07960 [Natrarchaeobius chitinivorans]|uniref:Uncharacterized protein n=1 Tax=Natrarchaeobius chitinivorans TaxID=1679083 RepID=A0A3N6N9Z7_NATCH|nr:hypothetical protein EA473_07960 [Natrarchaeobius chitinivorans]